MTTQREKILRIKQLVQDGMLGSYGFTKEQEEEILNFVVDNADKLRELSLRTVIKAADLRNSFDSWQEVAMVTLFKHN